MANIMLKDIEIYGLLNHCVYVKHYGKRTWAEHGGNSM